jgi:hypothetical protein
MFQLPTIHLRGAETRKERPEGEEAVGKEEEEVCIRIKRRRVVYDWDILGMPRVVYHRMVLTWNGETRIVSDT